MQRRGIHIILAALGLYGLAFILRSSFIVEGKRYFCLLDDAMISMRYAKNFAAGNGLVWNTGEYVEGFTNLLWTLYMSLWHLLPIEPRFMSLPIQLTSLAALIFAAYQAYRIAVVVLGENKWALAATAISAFYWPALVWALLGMEVGIITALLLLVIRWMVEGRIEGWRLPATYLLFGVLTLIRIDTAIFAVALSLYIAWKQPALRVRHVALLCSTLLIFIGGQTLWRYQYYGEIFPNTYYLKATGWPVLYRITRGLYQLFHFAFQPGLLLLALPIAWNIWRKTSTTNLLLIVATVAALYSAYVGGDAWEWYGGANRYLSPVMPLFFILLFRSIKELWQIIEDRLSLPRKALVGVAIAGLAILHLTFSANNVNDWNPSSLEELTFISMPFQVPYHIERVKQAQWLERNTKPGARIAVVWAGVEPYFSDRYFIDLYGKTDKRIARLETTNVPGSRPGLAYLPGHTKWDYNYSIGELKPDVIAHLIKHAPIPYAHLANYDPVQGGLETVYFRKGSVYRGDSI